MRRRRSLRLAAAVLVAALAASAAPASVPPTTELPPLLPIPHPDLSAMEEAARRQVETAQGGLAQMLDRPQLPRQVVADAFGHFGQLLHAFKLLDAAETAYQNAKTLAGEDPRWPYLLGLVHNAQGRLEEATADYERALALDPEDQASLIRLGQALLELDRPADAEGRFARVLELDPGSAAAYDGLGKAAAARGDLKLAVERFEKALELEPGANAVHYPLGQAYRKLGDLEAARRHLSQRGQEQVRFPDPLGTQVSRLAKTTAFEIVLGLARDAERFEPDEFLGFALSQLADVPGTIEELESGLALREQPDASGEEPASDVERARIHYVLGGLLVQEGRDDEAAEHFRKVLELDPTLGDARVKLGNALARRGRFEEALAVYDAALESAPDDHALLLKRAAALMELDRRDEARRDLERLVALAPEMTEPRMRLAALLERAGETDAAIAAYRGALELDLTAEEKARADYHLAGLLRDAGDYRGAGDHYAAALEADPAFVPALADLAGLFGQLGLYDQAARAYAAWVEKEPKKVRPRVGEATALILGGHHAEARARLESSLEALPDEIALQDLLARHLAACPDHTVRDGPRAVALATRVYTALPTAESAETLAMAYAEAGRFDRAVELQRQLLGELGAEADAATVARLRGNLSRYEALESCCVEESAPQGPGR